MKTLNMLYENVEKLKDFIKKNSIKNQEMLIQVFVGSLDDDLIKKATGDLAELLPLATIIGTTTAGEIINGGISDNSVVISFTIFEATSIKSSYIDSESNDYFNMGIKIANELIESNTKAIILFSDTLHANREDLLKGIESVKKDLIVAGGVAGDNFEIVGGKVFIGSKIISNGSGIVGVSLNSARLEVHTTYSMGWQEIGKLMEVTEVDENRLYTLNGIPAFEMYKKYLGKEISDNLMNFAGAEFPIIIKRDGVKIAREALTVHDDGSIIYSGKLYKGEKIQFGYGNVNLVLQNIKEITKELNRLKPETVFIYSCAARKAFLKNEVLSEIEPVEKIATTAGFFTYGEFFHLNKRNETLNMTMTMLAMSEKGFDNKIEKEKIGKVKEYYDEKSMANIRALTHLVKVVTNELEEKNRELENQNHKILESINYAEKIQTAILPHKDGIIKRLPDNFIIWRPRDIVGGDLYWYKETHNNQLFIAVIDCTGHGVPGAFMTMMANSILHHIIDEICEDCPSKILSELNALIKRTLQKEQGRKKERRSDDGLDIGLCLLKPNENELIYSGAKIPLIYHDEDGIHLIKGNKQSIGYAKSKEDYKYTDHKIKLADAKTFYMFSDGITDQNRENSQVWFGKERLLKILAKSSDKELRVQKELLLKEFDEFKGTEAQRDDITLIGFKIK